MSSLYLRTLRSDEYFVYCEKEMCGEEGEYKITVNETATHFVCKKHLRELVNFVLESE